METEPAKPQPTLEDCLRLLPTCKGYNKTWNVQLYPGGSHYVNNNGLTIAGFDSACKLHQWLTDRQLLNTVTVEILREDAETVAAMTTQDLLVRRFSEACKKGLQAS